MPAIERSGLLTTDLVAKPARATMAALSPVIEAIRSVLGP